MLAPISHSLLASDTASAHGSSNKLAMFEKRAYEIAQAQFMAQVQTAFTMWMFIGNQLQIFSIFFLANMGLTPVWNILNVNNGGCS